MPQEGRCWEKGHFEMRTPKVAAVMPGAQGPGGWEQLPGTTVKPAVGQVAGRAPEASAAVQT